MVPKMERKLQQVSGCKELEVENSSMDLWKLLRCDAIWAPGDVDVERLAPCMQITAEPLCTFSIFLW